MVNMVMRKMRRAIENIELILFKRMFGQYDDKKDEEDPELDIEIFLKSDFKMISFCKILDFMFLD